MAKEMRATQSDMFIEFTTPEEWSEYEVTNYYFRRKDFELVFTSSPTEPLITCAACRTPRGSSGTIWQCDELAGRKPTLSLQLPGSFLLRYAERQFLAVLFQLPPRMTRFPLPMPSPPGSKSVTCSKLEARPRKPGAAKSLGVSL